MFFNIKYLTRAAIIAALYAALTVMLAPISFGMIQFRVAEALTALPLVMAEAVPGLAIGCLVANLLGGGMPMDVVFGALATLLAAIATRRLRSRPALALAAPVVFNGIIVGPVVYICYEMAEGLFSFPALAFTSLSIAFCESVVVYTLGWMTAKSLNRLSMRIR